jgi:hypothetical protein
MIAENTAPLRTAIVFLFCILLLIHGLLHAQGSHGERADPRVVFSPGQRELFTGSLPSQNYMRKSTPLRYSGEYSLGLTPFAWHYLGIPFDSSNNLVFRHYSVSWYDEPSHRMRMISVTSDSSLTTPMLGYAAFSTETQPDSLVLEMAGRFNTGGRSIPLTRTWDPGSTPPSYDGWNLVGNPYPSGTDWESPGWDLSNVDPVAYFFDGVNYRPFNRNNQYGNGTRFIPPLQGFFVHVTGGTGGMLSVSNIARVHTNQPFYKDYPADPDLMVVQVAGNGYADETWIHFDPGSSAGFDTWSDAYKRSGIPASPQVWSILPDADASINVLPFTGSNTIVPLGFTAGVADGYSLTAGNIFSFSQGSGIWLEDMKLNAWQDLIADSVYLFTAAPGDDPARFRIHFDYIYNPVPAITSGAIRIYASGSAAYVIQDNFPSEAGSFAIYNLVGQIVYTGILLPQHQNVYHLQLPRGCYVLVAKSARFCIAQKAILGQG